MNRVVANHAFIFFTIVFTVYSQLVMRWRVNEASPLPADFAGKIQYVVSLLLTPWVMSAMVATLLAGVSWMLAMTKFEISYAYPFVSLNYILVMAGGYFLFQESVSFTKLVGGGLVILGIIVISRG